MLRSCPASFSPARRTPASRAGRGRQARFSTGLYVLAVAAIWTLGTVAALAAEASAGEPVRPKDREASVRAIAARVGLGPGGKVADIGAGKGADSFVFADIVGPEGAVYAEEIGEGMVKSLKQEADKRQVPQVQAILGRDDDPCLPADMLDLAYIRIVYHHFTKPREMLRKIWTALKPGGYLVVVDRQRGTLRDWVPREQRGPKHFWIAETTVVREAREEGFLFDSCPDDCWFEKEAFTLVFRRPAASTSQAGRDPDALQPLAEQPALAALVPAGTQYQRVALIALGPARALIPSILEKSQAQAVEIVLEEWATQKAERPPMPEGAAWPAQLTDLGDPNLGPEPLDAVFFLDTYHLLFHGPKLLGKLRERLTDDGCLVILDRQAEQPLSRREASHRRQIQPEVVKQELEAAGFILRSEAPPPAADRFLMVFGPKPKT